MLSYFSQCFQIDGRNAWPLRCSEFLVCSCGSSAWSAYYNGKADLVFAARWLGQLVGSPDNICVSSRHSSRSGLRQEEPCSPTHHVLQWGYLPDTIYSFGQTHSRMLMSNFITWFTSQKFMNSLSSSSAFLFSGFDFLTK